MGTARRLGVAAMMAALVLVSACGRETKQAVSVSPDAAKSTDFTGDPESAYCRAALEWAVVEMTPRDGSVPGETKYWNGYAAFLTHAKDVGPTEIKSDLGVYVDKVLNTVMPVLRKYGFDEKRFMGEATEEEKKAVMENPPAVEKAFGQILRYEWQVCGNGTPDAATNVKFSGDKNSTYCKVEAEGEAAFNKIREGGYDPADVKAFRDVLDEALTKKQRVAPVEIKSDVAADANWVRTKQFPTLAKWSYDFKKVKLQAPAADRFAIDMSAVDIRDVERRLNAYDEQVCGL